MPATRANPAHKLSLVLGMSQCCALSFPEDPPITREMKRVFREHSHYMTSGHCLMVLDVEPQLATRLSTQMYGQSGVCKENVRDPSRDTCLWARRGSRVSFLELETPLQPAVGSRPFAGQR